MAHKSARPKSAAEIAKHEEWKALYRQLSQTFIEEMKPGKAFTGEDIRRYLEPFIGKPYTAHCWGGMSVYAIDNWRRSGVIKRDGFRKMESRKAHSRLTPYYRKTGPVPIMVWNRVFG